MHVRGEGHRGHGSRRGSRGKTKRNGRVRPGDTVRVEAFKADGKPYRWWRATVESVDDNHIALLNRIGDVVTGIERPWSHHHNIRTTYWFARPYNLAELYEPDGTLKQLYVHIASPARLEGRVVQYADHELDVVKRTGQPPRVADVDEFEAAAAAFGYSPEFQESCWRAVTEATELVRCWKPAGPPRWSWWRAAGSRSPRKKDAS